MGHRGRCVRLISWRSLFHVSILSVFDPRTGWERLFIFIHPERAWSAMRERIVATSSRCDQRSSSYTSGTWSVPIVSPSETRGYHLQHSRTVYQRGAGFSRNACTSVHGSDQGLTSQSKAAGQLSGHFPRASPNVVLPHFACYLTPPLKLFGARAGTHFDHTWSA